MRRLTPTELQDTAKQFRTYFDEIKKCIVGRDYLIDLMMYAFLLRHHLLTFGPPGTAKTLLCDLVFGGITGANKFQIEGSMFMGEDAFFGPYDTAKMRDPGILEHRVEGMLPEAHFARLGEFLDLSMPTMRALLGSLNERELRRGRQILKMPLMTTFCDTNKDPAEILKKDPYMWAVLDRILLMTQVDFLEDPDEMAEMIRRFQSGKTTRLKPTISLKMINALSEPVVCPPSLITDQLIYIKLGQAMLQYRQERQQVLKAGQLDKAILPVISDRRMALASQMMEVAAILDGRFQIKSEDMRLCHHVLGTTRREQQIWTHICDQKIQEIEAEKSQQLDHSQIVAIKAILSQAEMINGDDFRMAGDTLGTLEHQLNGIVPDNGTVEEQKVQARTKLCEIRTNLQTRLLETNGLG